MVKFIKDAWHRNEVVSALFLDVKGAFPSISVKHLVHNPRTKGIPREYTEWIKRKLAGHRTTISFDDFTSAPFNVEDRCDQGCPMSVILYLHYNAGLIEVAQTTKGELATGFIDDVVYLASGPDLECTHRKIVDMMERPQGGFHWSATHSSSFEPDKLRLVDFTRRREPTSHPGCPTAPITRPPLTLRQQRITPMHSYKYLGVVLDQELRFREHTAYALSRGTAWVLQFRRLSRPTMGMPPRYARQLYKAIAVPRMLYAADVFLTPLTRREGDAKAKGSVGLMRKLARVQRMAAIHITGAMRSTATDILDAHADLLPFPLLVNQICLRSAIRLASLLETHLLHKHVKRARRYVKRHRAPIHELLHAFAINPDGIETISAVRRAPGWKKEVEVRKAVNKETAYWEGADSRAGTRVYMDGSDIDRGVGAAAILFKDGQRQSTLRAYLRESTQHTVYKAELVGILLVAHLLRQEGCSQNIEIGTDNQAAIDALNLNKPVPSHYIVDEAQNLIRRVKLENPSARLLVCWTPGHMGIAGNKMADAEAKQAVARNASPPHTLPALLCNPLPISMSAARRTQNDIIKCAAAAHLAKSKCYPHLRSIDATIPSLRFRKLTAKLTQKQASLLIQLRMGHIPLNQHLAQIGVAESPACPACHEREETVHHYLLVCPAYATQRRMHFAKLARDAHSMSRLLTHPEAMKPLFCFITATRRLAKTFDGLCTDRQRVQQPTP